MTNQKSTVGIAWYRKEDWPRWLAIDPGFFHPDYQHWLDWFETTFQRHQADGLPVVKVIMDPDDFLAWGKATGNGTDLRARTAYVAVIAMRKHDAN